MKRQTGLAGGAPARRRRAGWSRGIPALAVVGLVLAACSSSAAVNSATGTPGATNTQAATATPAASATPEASGSAAPSELATGVPTALDPCQLVTAQEASTFAGATYGAGKLETTSGNGKICVYGGNTANVFEVIVGQAPDVATAQAGKAAAEAEIGKQAGDVITFTELPNFADGAAYVVKSMTISGQQFSGSAFYALKGTVFFGFSDIALGHATPNLAAMEVQATTILGRLP